MLQHGVTKGAERRLFIQCRKEKTLIAVAYLMKPEAKLAAVL
jgi:hypothetical protein